MSNRIILIIEWIIFTVFCVAILTYSAPPPTDEIERVRAYTRAVEFNYVNWVTKASLIKLQQASAGIPYNLGRVDRKQIVTEYLAVTERLLEYEYVLEQIYTDPNIKDKEKASRELRTNLNKVQARQNELAPFAEAVLQEQISQTLTELKIASTGQPIPSVSYHSSHLPNALIVSPRDHIEQIANISVLPDLTTDQKNNLEQRVDKGLDVSSLVEPVGGIGVYPTMIMRTTDLPWMLETISHEWTHNFLTLRPLGMLYGETPELRTMNETTASIVGNEVGRLVLERFYPELGNASHADPSTGSGQAFELAALYQAPAISGSAYRADFDFRAEMHTTRVRTDELLAAGKVKEAEAYMEARRQIFWQNGYQIRKLNQAYFAFHGAYADVPGGAAGEDPVGPAVRALREQSTSLADFLKTISWMTSFKQLRQAVH
jgi:hypothetical protein